MRLLPLEYDKNSYHFKQLERVGDVAIYEQWDGDHFLAYEVFEVMKNEDRVIAGKSIAASESTPSNEQWGRFGYTVHGISAAREKQAQLLAQIEDRKNRPTGVQIPTFP